MQRGIASNRMLAKGFGKSRPMASNSSETGRQQNRRVEITILNEGEILR
jgi:outer membrane protein OmpA-like peptidoglycan-associated protein